MTNFVNYILDENYYYNNMYSLNYQTTINIHIDPAILNNYNLITSAIDIMNNYTDLEGVDKYIIHEWINKLYVPMNRVDNVGTSDLDVNYIITFSNWFITT